VPLLPEQQARERIDAMLVAAFQDRLVPQDPNDESASVLLDRIRAQAAAIPPPAPRRGRPLAQPEVAVSVVQATPTSTHRGRPPGSKNKAKA